jgi:hypothetical protein
VLDQLDTLTKRRIRLAATNALPGRATSSGEYLSALNLAGKIRVASAEWCANPRGRDQGRRQPYKKCDQPKRPLTCTSASDSGLVGDASWIRT